MIRKSILTLVFMIAANCFADVVVMKNGDIHEAMVGSFDGNELEATIANGKIILERAEVAAIYFGVGKDQLNSKLMPLSDVDATKLEKEPDSSITPFGEARTAGHIRIRITDAKIERPAVRTIVGGVQYGNDECLVLVLDIENLDDRRILQYSENFFTPLSLLQDDVENKILRVNYGLGNTIVGALATPEDIDPGKRKSHAEVFRKPPPKTKRLIYTIDLKAFQASGQLRFMVPIEKVRGFHVP